MKPAYALIAAVGLLGGYYGCGGSSSSPTLPRGPIADAAGPYQAEVARPVTFDGTQSMAGTSPIVRYEWNPGDETGTITGPTPQHTYSANLVAAGSSRTFTVTLLVTDSAGVASTAQTTCLVTRTY